MDEEKIMTEDAPRASDIEDATNEESSFLNKIADISGLFLGLLITTGIAGLALAFFLTFIPNIHFSLMHVLKCWSGTMVIPLIRGIIHNQP